MSREFVYRALVGSHNYNLNIPSSDRDYIQFFIPTFEDIYKGKPESKVRNFPGMDVTEHDIRRLPELLWKANVNFLEILFSIDYFATTHNELHQILDKKRGIARMNLPYLYNSSFGLSYEKRKTVYKNGQFNPKDAYAALRILDFIIKFHNSEFEDYQGSIRYKILDPMRLELLAVRNNDNAEERYIRLVNELLPQVEKLKECYHSFEPNQELLNEVEEACFNMVKISLETELRTKR